MSRPEDFGLGNNLTRQQVESSGDMAFALAWGRGQYAREQLNEMDDRGFGYLKETKEYKMYENDYTAGREATRSFLEKKNKAISDPSKIKDSVQSEPQLATSATNNYEENINRVCAIAGVKREEASVKVGNAKIYPLREGINPSSKQIQNLTQKLSHSIDWANGSKGEVPPKSVITVFKGKDPLLKIKNGMIEQQSSQEKESSLLETKQVVETEYKPETSSYDPNWNKSEYQDSYTSLLNQSFKEQGADISATYKELQQIATKAPSLAKDFDVQVADMARKQGIDENRVGPILAASPYAQTQRNSNIELVRKHLNEIRNVHKNRNFDVSKYVSKNSFSLNETKERFIDTAKVAQQNLRKISEKTKSFSLKEWASTQAQNINKSLTEYVSKQVQSVKNWAISKYPDIRNVLAQQAEKAINTVKQLDDRMMGVVARNGLTPERIRHSAEVIVAHAGKNGVFSNEKIQIDLTGDNLSINVEGNKVYSGNALLPSVTQKDLDILVKLRQKANEMIIHSATQVSNQRQLIAQSGQQQQI